MSVTSPAGRWAARAEDLLNRALGEHRDEADAIASTTEALACLYRALGEAPDLVRIQAGDLVLDEPERMCTCPPGLAARGGFRGGCPSHAAS